MPGSDPACPPPSPPAGAVALAERYLDLVERSLMNDIHGESRVEAWLQRWALRLAHPWQTRKGGYSWPPRAQTMIGRARLDHLRRLVEIALSEGIGGDFIETGVWRGGACILMRAVLAAHGAVDRRVFVADSFEGLPRPDARAYPADRGDRLFSFRELAVSQAQVRRNFAAYGLLDDQVVFLEGLFKDTLPRLTDERFALIRLDGDMYESTMDALTGLYDRLSSGGFVVIDDYGVIGACRRAVHDFLDARALSPSIEAIDETGVWWRKP
ncbi:MAG TPA: TylF/MycF/NovP-related O-methyltransferase [Caulobacteraceae bacterium]|nr:TylF/MycF/NovP-related O-methyltransferase [Caulobacteraceae bacterium]